jgi:hypothetical protein
LSACKTSCKTARISARSPRRGRCLQSF